LLPRQRLREEAENLLKSFLKEVEPLAPRCIMLYGSYARGDFTENSDIDVCVIADNLPKDELERRCLKGLYATRKIRAIGFHPEEFLQYIRGLRFLAYDIAADGVPIYGKGFHSEIRRLYDECLKKHNIQRDEKGWRLSSPNK